jgi:hypothetical protein
MDEGTVTPIDSRRPGSSSKRRGDQVVPPERRSQNTSHLPADATRADVRRAGKVVRAKRRADVLTLAAAGHHPEAIAEQLADRYTSQGLAAITKGSVERIINDTLTDLRESDLSKIDAVRTMQLSRLDRALQAIGTKVAEGNLKAIDRMLKIEALRAKIAGTEAPKKLEVTGSIALGVEQEEVERGERAWLEAGGPDVDVIDVDPADVEEVDVDAPQE